MPKFTNEEINTYFDKKLTDLATLTQTASSPAVMATVVQSWLNEIRHALLEPAPVTEYGMIPTLLDKPVNWNTAKQIASQMLSDGWRIPTVAELTKLFEARNEQKTLTQNRYGDWKEFWSCETKGDLVMYVYMGTGKARELTKTGEASVVLIRP